MQLAGSTVMKWRKSGISVVTRSLIGLPLAAVLSVIGMVTASTMSVFFGVAGLSTLLAMLMIGAGTGGAVSGNSGNAAI